MVSCLFGGFGTPACGALSMAGEFTSIFMHLKNLFKFKKEYPKLDVINNAFFFVFFILIRGFLFFYLWVTTILVGVKFWHYNSVACRVFHVFACIGCTFVELLNAKWCYLLFVKLFKVIRGEDDGNE